jgi:3-(3-hydroxy-phenyl)propionate hydroxylase
MSCDRVDVLIAGGGPTGLALANALGAFGHDVLVVEQDPGVAELPRAVSIDDEAMRFMQALGLLEATRGVVLPGTGTKYFGAAGQLLMYGRGPARARYGHPIKNPMDHSELQQVLLDGLRRFPNVEVRHLTRLVSLTQDGEGVTAQLDSADATWEVRAGYLVGADGGRSTVRTAIGQEPMSGSAFEERWLVLDTVNDTHDERFAMHYGDPQRPRVIVVGRGGRCRYEFLVHDHERPREDEVVSFAMDLVRPYRALDPTDIVRCTIYRFYALVADEFRRGRVFIAGDAAHMMPPFAGQGLNSGLRDAFNLGWKLDLALRGNAGDRLLDTYTEERRPHVSAMVRLSIRMGAVMMTRSSVRARARDCAFMVGQRLPGVQGFLREMRFKPPATYESGLFVGLGAESSGAAVGSMLVQPRVVDAGGRLVDLDDVLGGGFALIAVGDSPAALDELSAPLWQRLGARRVHLAVDDRLAARDTLRCVSVADADGLLGEQLADLRGRIVVVRPDRFAAGSFVPSDEAAFVSALEQRLGVPARSGSIAREAV